MADFDISNGIPLDVASSYFVGLKKTAGLQDAGVTDASQALNVLPSSSVRYGGKYSDGSPVEIIIPDHKMQIMRDAGINPKDKIYHTEQLMRDAFDEGGLPAAQKVHDESIEKDWSDISGRMHSYMHPEQLREKYDQSKRFHKKYWGTDLSPEEYAKIHTYYGNKEKADKHVKSFLDSFQPNYVAPVQKVAAKADDKLSDAGIIDAGRRRGLQAASAQLEKARMMSGSRTGDVLGRLAGGIVGGGAGYGLARGLDAGPTAQLAAIGGGAL